MKRVLILAAAVLLAPASGEAQTTTSSITQLCSTSGTSTGLNACVSFFVRTTVAGGNTAVVLHVQNSDWNTGNVGAVQGYLINRVAILTPDLTGTVSNFAVGTFGGAASSGSGTWSNAGPSGKPLPGYNGAIEFIAHTTPGSTSTGGIEGSFVSSGIEGYRTINAGQWVTFSFTLTGQALHAGADNFAYGFKAQSFGDGGSLSCPAATCVPTTTVPEPISMVLMGTGLVGTGIAARRRRKALLES